MRGESQGLDRLNCLIQLEHGTWAPRRSCDSKSRECWHESSSSAGVLPNYDLKSALHGLRAFRWHKRIQPDGSCLHRDHLSECRRFTGRTEPFVTIPRQRWAPRKHSAHGKGSGNVNAAARADLSQLVEGRKAFNVAGSIDENVE